MHIEQSIQLDFKDVLMKPQRSTLASRSDVDLEREYHFLHSERTWKGTGIIVANMSVTGTFTMAQALAPQKMLVAIHKHYTLDQWISALKAHPEMIPALVPSIGWNESEIDRLDSIIVEIEKYHFQYEWTHMVRIDVPNGYSEGYVDYIKMLRLVYPYLTFMVGNVATPEMTSELILAGADIVVGGIGGGSACKTREKAAVGIPQFSMIIDCANAAHGLGGMFISDGGCTCPGDICKAFGAGADMVMVGGMFSGHDECECEIISKHYTTNELEWANGGWNPVIEEKKFMEFYGMSSVKANEKYAGGMKSYRASEGRELLVPYKGPVAETIQDILGSISSCMTYIGARRLKDIPKCATFVRVNQQLNESLKKFDI
jgi:GMP reductase